MTLILLVRHAQGDHVGRALAGRTPVPLNAEGLAAAHGLAEALRELPLDAIYSSPRLRATDTVAPLASQRGLDVITMPELDELDFGEWTGRSYESLDDDLRWRHFNEFRAGTPAPGGELMLEAQARIVRALVTMRDAHPGGIVMAVSHADVIRGALAHWLGAPTAQLLDVTLDPASVSVLDLRDDAARVLAIGVTPVQALQTISSSR